MIIEITNVDGTKTYENAYRCWITKGKIEFRFVENDEPMIMGYDIDKCDSIIICEKDWNGYDWTGGERYRGSGYETENK